MTKLQVVNIKCGGCANTITKSLESLGATNITIDIPTQMVSFEWDEKLVVEKLTNLGYPLANSEAAKSLLKKGISYVSCAIWKINT